MICTICNKEFHNRLPNEDICDKCMHHLFSKKSWKDTLDNDALIINHTCYHIGNSNYPSGYGIEEKLKIRILGTEEIIEANGNLWCNGEIPEEFLVPDNAEFVE